MIVFMGTPDCAVSTLRALVEAGEEVFVITQPDRPRGRGRKVQPPPVKVVAQELGLSVWQPESVNTPEAVARLQALSPEFIVVVAFGQILKPEVLAVPQRGCVNAHFSLLPRYRGAAPVNWTLIRGETETGVTTMLMDEGLDTGPILLQEREPIRPEDNAGTLEERLAVKAAPLMLKTLQGLRQGTITPRPQDHSQATYAPRLKKEDLLLRWDQPALDVVHRVRGLAPRPGAYTFHRHRRLKILRAQVADNLADWEKGGIPGTVVKIHPRQGFAVQTRGGCVWVLEVQPEGGRPMGADEYLRGRGRMEVGERLGEAST
jgi:methionyl-tRNA formyltransferase